jgi:lysophospholipase L1-like esterase
MTCAGALAVLVVGAVASCWGQAATNAAKKAYGPPGKFEKEIQAFEAADQKAFPPAGAIVCLGSSSMRMWHSAIREDLSPLTVIPRGFGGSTMSEALHVVGRVVVPYKPRAILLYEGDNDIGSGIAPETVRDTFLALVTKVRASLPGVRVYVIAVKPSVKRWALWPQMREANRLLAEACAAGEGLTFIDVATPMLDASGNVRKELLKSDNLHMTRAGYEVWRDAVKPVLHKGELASEATK